MIKIITLAALISSSAIFVAEAAPARSVWDGIYTDAQAARGKIRYGGNCVECHGVALEGNYLSPPLTGEFVADWDGMTMADLFDKVQRTMPLGHPASLSDADTADMLAYMLQLNNFPSGEVELGSSPDVLNSITFEARKPVALKVRARRHR
jgi:cytochrome c